MLKQQTVPTAMGQLTVTSLTLGELRDLESIFTDSASGPGSGVSSLLKFLPIIFSSLRKVHLDLTSDQLETGLTLDDFSALLNATLEVSGLKKAPPGEPIPVPV